MNPRIRDLIEQFATNLLNRSGYDMREYEPFLKESEKFAELIVQECIAEHALLASAADKLRISHSEERMELLRQRDQATAQRDALLSSHSTKNP